jgi:hypothetical protein
LVHFDKITLQFQWQWNLVNFCQRS